MAEKFDFRDPFPISGQSPFLEEDKEEEEDSKVIGPGGLSVSAEDQPPSFDWVNPITPLADSTTWANPVKKLAYETVEFGYDLTRGIPALMSEADERYPDSSMENLKYLKDWGWTGIENIGTRFEQMQKGIEFQISESVSSPEASYSPEVMSYGGGYGQDRWSAPIINPNYLEREELRAQGKQDSEIDEIFSKRREPALRAFQEEWKNLEKVINKRNKDANLGEYGSIAASGVESAAIIASGIALNFATGGTATVPTTTTILGYFGLQTQGISYGEARRQGLPHGEAVNYANINALLEVGTEALPVLRYMRPIGGKRVTDIFKRGLVDVTTDVGMEVVNGVLQEVNTAWFDLESNLKDAYDNRNNPLYDGPTVGEALTDVASHSFLAAIIASGGISSAITTGEVVYSPEVNNLIKGYKNDPKINEFVDNFETLVNNSGLNHQAIDEFAQTVFAPEFAQYNISTVEEVLAQKILEKEFIKPKITPVEGEADTLTEEGLEEKRAETETSDEYFDRTSRINQRRRQQAIDQDPEWAEAREQNETINQSVAEQVEEKFPTQPQEFSWNDPLDNKVEPLKVITSGNEVLNPNFSNEPTTKEDLNMWQSINNYQKSLESKIPEQIKPIIKTTYDTNDPDFIAVRDKIIKQKIWNNTRNYNGLNEIIKNFPDSEYATMRDLLPDEVNNVATAALNLINLGMPIEIFDDLGSILVAGKDSFKNVRQNNKDKVLIRGIYSTKNQYLLLDPTVGVTTGEAMKTKTNLSEKQLKDLDDGKYYESPMGAKYELMQILSHELAHHIDSYQSGFDGLFASQGSPLFDIDINDFTSKFPGISTGPGYQFTSQDFENAGLGPILAEAVSMYLNESNSLEDSKALSAAMLGYPLKQLFSISSREEILEKGKDPKDYEAQNQGIVDLVKSETFAQLYAMYYANKDLLREQAPQTYKFIEEVNNAISVESSGAKNERLLSVFRSSDPRRNLEGDARRRIDRDVGPSLEEQQAGQAVGEQTLTTDRDNLRSTVQTSQQVNTTALLDFIKQNPEGFTFDPITLESPTSGFAVSPIKALELVVDQDGMTKEDARQFAKNVADLAKEMDQPVFAGGWLNPDNGKYYLDATIVFDKKEDALYTAEAAQQIAIFDLGTFNETKTEEGIQELKDSGRFSSKSRDERRTSVQELSRLFEESRNQNQRLKDTALSLVDKTITPTMEKGYGIYIEDNLVLTPQDMARLAGTSVWFEKVPGYENTAQLPDTYVTTIDPDTFLDLTTEDPAQKRTIEKEAVERLGEYWEVDRRRDDINMGFASYLTIDKKGKVIGHEGRHRAVLLASFGIKKMPILIKRGNWDKVYKPELLKGGEVGLLETPIEAFLDPLSPLTKRWIYKPKNLLQKLTLSNTSTINSPVMPIPRGDTNPKLSRQLREEAYKTLFPADALQQKIKVFHGSPKDFYQFREHMPGSKKGGGFEYGYGIYLTDKPDYAKNFSEGEKRRFLYDVVIKAAKSEIIEAGSYLNTSRGKNLRLSLLTPEQYQKIETAHLNVVENLKETGLGNPKLLEDYFNSDEASVIGYIEKYQSMFIRGDTEIDTGLNWKAQEWFDENGNLLEVEKKYAENRWIVLRDPKDKTGSPTSPAWRKVDNVKYLTETKGLKYNLFQDALLEQGIKGLLVFSHGRHGGPMGGTESTYVMFSPKDVEIVDQKAFSVIDIDSKPPPDPEGDKIDVFELLTKADNSRLFNFYSDAQYWAVDKLDRLKNWTTLLEPHLPDDLKNLNVIKSTDTFHGVVKTKLDDAVEEIDGLLKFLKDKKLNKDKFNDFLKNLHAPERNNFIYRKYSADIPGLVDQLERFNKVKNLDFDKKTIAQIEKETEALIDEFVKGDTYRLKLEKYLDLLKRKEITKKGFIEFVKDEIVRKADRDAITTKGKITRATKVVEKYKDSGSGIKTQDAIDNLKKMGIDFNEASLTATATNKIGENLLEAFSMLEKYQEKTREIYKETDLISEDSIADWRENYRYYVPLVGFSVDTIEGDTPNKKGTGNSLYGSVVPEAKGRLSEAGSPFEQAVSRRAQSVVLGEKNKINKELAELIKAFPENKLWDIKDNVGRFDKPHSWDGKESLIPYKDEGQTRFLVIKDERLAKGLDAWGSSDINPFLSTMRGFTGFLSTMYTSLNPEFIVGNFFRDYQAGFYNLMTEREMGRAMEMKLTGALSPKKMPGIFKILHQGYTTETLKEKDPENYKYFRAFKEYGGQTGYINARDLDEIEKEMKILSEAHSGKNLNPRTVFKATFGLVEKINNAVENAPRFAVFKAWIEEVGGVDKATPQDFKDAASMAKNLTINFNRSGKLGPAVNALYIFANASVQGSVNFFRGMVPVGFKEDGSITYKPISRAKMAVMGGAVSLGGLIALYNTLVSGEDDDGKLYIDKIPQHEQERNLIIMLPGVSYEEGEPVFDKVTRTWSVNKKPFAISIPLPYGYSIFFNLGRYGVEHGTDSTAGYDRRTIIETAKDITGLVTTAFAPVAVGGSEDGIDPVKTIIPSVLQPFYDIQVNETWTGAPVYKEQIYGGKVPQSAVKKRTTEEFYREFTMWLNEASGGGPADAGSINISPDILKFLAQSYLGGMYTMAERTYSLSEKLYDQVTIGESEEIVLNDLPFVRVLTAEPVDWTDAKEFYEYKEFLRGTPDKPGSGVINSYEEYAEKHGGEALKSYMERTGFDERWLAADKLLKKIDKKLTKLAEQEKEIEKAKKYMDRATYIQAIKNIEDVRYLLYRTYNEQARKILPR